VTGNTPKGGVNSLDLRAPQTYEEAVMNNDLDASMEIANDVNNNLSVELEGDGKQKAES